MSKIPQFEERYVVAKTQLELESTLSTYRAEGWKSYGPMRQEAIQDTATGEHQMMFIQYMCKEEDTTYSRWYRENRRLSINYTHD